MTSRAFILWPALAMSLGWGLRGYIGGGPFGAMIPGAMAALALCRLAGLTAAQSAQAAAFGAIGIGFGGEMTYGQTVGFIREPETFLLGLAGLSLKGAVWGLLGGAILACGWHITANERALWGKALTAFCALTAVGWATVNRPKLIYFSNLLDRPREEVWAGLLFGAVALIAVVTRNRPELRPVRSFAVAGFLGGGAGFGLGGLWMFIGSQWITEPTWIPWWKFMEFTFGACFGAALGWCAHRNLDWIRRACENKDSQPVSATAAAGSALAGLVSVVAVLYLDDHAPIRFSFAVLGAALLWLAANVVATLWPIALGLTATAFFFDWAEYHVQHPAFGSPETGWAMASFASLAFFAALSIKSRQPHWRPNAAFWLLTATAVATSWAKALLDSPHGLFVEQILFTVMMVGLLRGIELSVESRADVRR